MAIISEKAAFSVMAVCLGIMLLGSVFYFPIYYAIYYPYFEVPWKKSKCSVDSIETYKVFWYSDSETGAEYYVYYSLYHVRVDIEGTWKRGFACGSELASITSGSVGLDGSYPYEYGTCPNPEICRNQLIMPVWYCNDCQKCTQFLKTSQQDCEWYLYKGSNSIDDADELPPSYDIEEPTASSTFIQVTLREGGAYYYKDDYNALVVICLYIMIVAPAGICFLALGLLVMQKIIN